MKEWRPAGDPAAGGQGDRLSALGQPVMVKPEAIEQRSFEIIAEELGPHPFTAEQFPVVQRVIHASADFELGRSLVFHPRAVRAGIEAIHAGRPIVADVQMVQVGISKPRLARFGCDVRVYISDPDVAEAAGREGVTRAIMAVRKAVREAPGAIFAIGNAPTALLELIRLVRAGEASPGLIVGVPVGFVAAAESKAELMALDVPFITNHGRKGGSPVAVAAINAIAILAERAMEDGPDGKRATGVDAAGGWAAGSTRSDLGPKG